MKIRRWTLGLIGAGMIAYGSSGLIVVRQDEIGVVRRLGAVTAEPYEPGLHLGLPWGLERVDRVKVDQARTFAVGARDAQAPPLSTAPNPSTDDFLTGDLNLVSAQAVVQFRIKNRTRAPIDYLFQSRSSDAALADLAEGALATALAGRSIDDVLTTGRADVADRLRRTLQEQADAQNLGVTIVAVRLGRVAPPDAVAPAFADAARAKSDKRQAMTRAEEYRDRNLAEARGLARETVDRAQGRHEELVQSAKGAADRFAKLLAEVQKNPMAARRRLYLDALAELLPRFARKVVVPAGRDVDLTLFAEEPVPTTEP
ncbi:MAG: FtsH protease activity modulator HflK [Isosphaeraceae bacterium]